MPTKTKTKKRFKNKQTAVEQDSYPEQAKQQERPYGGDDRRGPLDSEARDTNRDPRQSRDLGTDKANLKLWLLVFVGLTIGTVACQKTASQKVEDKMEDAGHEIKQGTERAGEKMEETGENVKENVKDATR